MFTPENAWGINNYVRKCMNFNMVMVSKVSSLLCVKYPMGKISQRIRETRT